MGYEGFDCTSCLHCDLSQEVTESRQAGYGRLLTTCGGALLTSAFLFVILAATQVYLLIIMGHAGCFSWCILLGSTTPDVSLR